MRRIWSLMLAVVMVFTSVDITALATSPETKQELPETEEEKVDKTENDEESQTQEDTESSESLEETDESDISEEEEGIPSAGAEDVESLSEILGEEEAPSAQEDVKENRFYSLLERGGDTSPVTRIEWLQALITAFQMTVEKDNYPDNYYSDIDSSSAYYRDVMVATEFGLVDVEAGDPLEPEKEATREFAVHTLNQCLGFQLENEGYTFNESGEVTYPDDIQVAINQN